MDKVLKIIGTIIAVILIIIGLTLLMETIKPPF